MPPVRWLAAALLLGGCFGPGIDDGAVSCAFTGLCPKNMACGDDGLCRRAGGDGDGDLHDPFDIPDLLLWYPLDADDFRGGADDASGGGRRAECNPSTCPSAVPGVIGGAARFDGQRERLRIAFDSQLNTESGFTLSAWARAEEFTTFNAVVSKPLETDTANTWQIELPDNFEWRFHSRSSRGTDEAFASAELDRWTHVAGRWDGERITLYIDGVAADSNNTDDILFDDHDVFIGGDENNGDETGFWSGDIDDVRIYDRALDDEEIARLADPDR